MWSRLLAALLCAAAAAGPEPSRLSVGLEPAVELAGAAQLMGGGETGWQFQAPGGGYRRFLTERLKKAAGRPALARAARDAPANYLERMEILARRGAAQDVSDLPYSILTRAGGPARVRSWLADLEELRAGLEPGWPREGPLGSAVDRLRARIEEAGVLAKIEAYASLRFRGSLTVWPTPFLRYKSMVNVVLRTDGGHRIVSVLGARLPLFGAPDFWSDRLPADLWHELGHGLFDELADLSADEIARRRPPAPYRPCYGDWRQCVKEHVARAVMLRLVAAEGGEAEGRKALELALRDGAFPYLAAMVESLRAYEASRASFPSLDEFYPRILAALPPAARERRPSEPDWVKDSAGMFPTAAQTLAALARLERLDPGAREPGVLFKRGALLLHLGELGRAERAARRALAAQPGHPGALRVLECVEARRRCLADGCGGGMGPSECGQLRDGAKALQYGDEEKTEAGARQGR